MLLNDDPPGPVINPYELWLFSDEIVELIEFRIDNWSKGNFDDLS